MAENETVGILERLGFAIETAAEGLQVSVPSWRCDVEGEADLVEEVIRVHGYAHVPEVAMERSGAVARPVLSRAQRRRGAVRRRLAARGLVEAVTWSFLPHWQGELFGGGLPSLRLANPISADLDTMRPSLLPNLIAAAGRNIDRGVGDAGLFEVGQVYADDTAHGQAMMAAAVRVGAAAPRHWSAKPRAVDVFDAKADALAALAAGEAPVASVQVADGAPAWYHPGRSGVIRLGPKTVLAAFGDIHPAILRRIDVKGPLAGFEVFLDVIPEPKAKAGHTRPRLDASDLPAVERDFAFVVETGVPAADLVRAAASADTALIAEVSVFDVYAGAAIEAGTKSVALSVRLEPVDHTLTEGEIDATSERVVAAVAKATGARLRE